jgi:hypothetical protein
MWCVNENSTEKTASSNKNCDDHLIEIDDTDALMNHQINILSH